MGSFDRGLFQSPGSEYRGMPFWAWNCRMDKEHIDNILKELKEMGMGGAYLHCRTGMDLPYLGKEFMEMIHYAHDRAGELSMQTGLYDEDRWPSGFAGGLVTQNPRYRGRYLLFSPECQPDLKYLAEYGVKLEGGYLKKYVRLLEGAPVPEGCEHWYAYLKVYDNDPWYNNQSYVNTLDPEAIREFLRVTYDAYSRELQDSFGKDIPAIFTDEPQFSSKTLFSYAEERKPQTISYTDDLEDTYKERYGYSLLDYLPEIFWELPGGKLSVHRYRYHNHVADRFAEAYADQLGAWCREHGLPLTGHMMREPELGEQTLALGEAMRSYRSFDIPGIDMLCDARELTTAKQAQSAVHQFGRQDMMCEIYGVTNWDFDFRGHKLAGDWQAALGVTKRVHHLTWTVMEGEAKRDYPASIGYQSPWYKEYPYIEDYFARINTVLRQGKPLVRLGVIHPIESFWLFWGDREHTEGIRREREEEFQNIVKWLLYGLIDFDFISEALLADWGQAGEKGFTAGEMTYDVILVPDCVTLRSSTLSRLEEFVQRGGKVIFAGQIPSYVDGLRDERVKALSERCRIIPYAREAVLGELQDVRLLDIRNEKGARTYNLLHQFRKQEDGLLLFIAHSEKSENPDLAQKEELYVEIEGCYSAEKLIPQTGEVVPQKVFYKDGKTCMSLESYEHDSFLFSLTDKVWAEDENARDRKKQGEAVLEQTAGNSREKGPVKRVTELSFPERVKAVLEEPNVLLLDQAMYSFDGGEWQPKEEILRIDNLCRQKLGYPLREEAYAQPWTQPKEEIWSHSLELLFTVESRWQTDQVMLALEKPEEAEIYWDERPVAVREAGYYTDRSIRKIPMPRLTEGAHSLRVKLPFYRKCNVEAMYLIGDFGVQAVGRSAVILPPVRELSFGDISVQGLAFYGGNIDYETEIFVPAGGELSLEASQFRCSLLKVWLDEEEKGCIAVSPYTLSLGSTEPGRHKIRIRMFGNRFNTFGMLHNCNKAESWPGPNAWRTRGTAWAYEYQLRRTGILKAPRLMLSE